MNLCDNCVHDTVEYLGIQPGYGEFGPMLLGNCLYCDTTIVLSRDYVMLEELKERVFVLIPDCLEYKVLGV